MKKTWYIIQAFRHMLHYTISMRTSQNETNKLNYGNFFSCNFWLLYAAKRKKSSKIGLRLFITIEQFFFFCHCLCVWWISFNFITLASNTPSWIFFYREKPTLYNLRFKRYFRRFQKVELNSFIFVLFSFWFCLLIIIETSYHSLFSCALHNFT